MLMRAVVAGICVAGCVQAAPWLCAGRPAPTRSAAAPPVAWPRGRAPAWRVLRLAGGADSSSEGHALPDPDAGFLEEDILGPRAVTFDGDGDGPPATVPAREPPVKLPFVHGGAAPGGVAAGPRRQPQAAPAHAEQQGEDDEARSACRLLPAACRLPPAACRLPPAACRLPPAACRLPPAASLPPQAAHTAVARGRGGAARV